MIHTEKPDGLLDIHVTCKVIGIIDIDSSTTKLVIHPTQLGAGTYQTEWQLDVVTPDRTYELCTDVPGASYRWGHQLAPHVNIVQGMTSPKAQPVVLQPPCSKCTPSLGCGIFEPLPFE